MGQGASQLAQGIGTEQAEHQQAAFRGDAVPFREDGVRRLEVLAERLRIDPAALQALLDNGQQMRRIPDSTEVDLWADSKQVL